MNAINFFASNFGGMELSRQVAYMGTQPSPQSPDVRMRELCRVLDTELEVLTNLLYLAKQKRLERDEYERYFEIAQKTVDRILTAVTERC